MKNKNKFWRIFLPYCIQKQEDGRYLVLNRKYKPLSFMTNEWVEYEKHPIAFKARITSVLAQKLSFNGDSSTEVIYLYNDGCTPTNKKAISDYFDRLALLLKLTVVYEVER